MNNITFELGDRVKIISECATFGKIGEVDRVDYDGKQTTIKFDEPLNGGNSKQVYNTLSIVKVDENEVEVNEKIEMINGKYIVKVRGSYGKSYYYNCRFEDVKVGDKIVCEDENYIQTVIGIYNETNSPIINPTKDVVCIIDYSEVNKRKERAKLLSKTKSELDSRVKEIQKKLDYEEYAKKDEVVAELLNKYKELIGGENNVH